jgi:hypothetical protein
MPPVGTDHKCVAGIGYERRLFLLGYAAVRKPFTRKRAEVRGRTITRQIEQQRSARRLLCRKMLGQSLPAFEVVVLKLRRFDGIAGEPHGEAALEHKSHRVLDLVRL